MRTTEVQLAHRCSPAAYSQRVYYITTAECFHRSTKSTTQTKVSVVEGGVGGGGGDYYKGGVKCMGRVG